MSNNRLIIFDTTMRDGEQSPGASMTKDEKLRIARALERMRVDVIEAGFPAASNGDFEAVSAIAKAVKDSVVCGLCRANDRDIQRGIDALKSARAWRIHTFIATSALHMEKKLRMTPEQVLEQARLSVRFAKNACGDVEFSPEDGSRSEMDFLCRVLEAVIKEGATTINIPDTVGYAVPQQFGEFIKKIREKVPNSARAVWSVHCHNDLGMAVANSLAAVKIGGARQIECTINGLGERAGNTSLEEVVMALRTRKDFFNLNTRIDTTHIVPTSRLVAQRVQAAPEGARHRARGGGRLQQGLPALQGPGRQESRDLRRGLAGARHAGRRHAVGGALEARHHEPGERHGGKAFRENHSPGSRPGEESAIAGRRPGRRHLQG